MTGQAAPLERYCPDGSAQYEWRVARGGGGMAPRQCFLYGSPELASHWATRATSFLPPRPGGAMAEYMVYRKHTYMRLDGSSKISERRDMVIFYDSDWNPTVDQQAMDRAHRLGQTKQAGGETAAGGVQQGERPKRRTGGKNEQEVCSQPVPVTCVFVH
ncbi:hypothetical protein CRUP_023596 [Coryphaenoides rupestris]|nr:hypothetical protein CRUP_023596 [Coryphaenoides rupestris]